MWAKLICREEAEEEGGLNAFGQGVGFFADFEPLKCFKERVTWSAW